MKANELRIGHWLQLPSGKCFQVDHNDISIISNWNKKAPLPMPIELTEEWLINFGFDVYEDKEYIKNGLDADLAFFTFNADFIYDMILYRNGVWIFTTAEGDCNENIQHVHQLQNLYFAITGEELEIN